ncbi:glycosyltransferase family 4 protein [Egbenema bharatensis]|uniref:glycosyltransferase family 4 protein n=1 Tax=Egbenema bharatensis TaxID=3463334 RepID=UPI003A8B3ED9
MSYASDFVTEIPVWGYGLVFLIALSIVLISIPIVKRFALQWGFIDQPSARKVHQQPIPRVGGISIFLGTTIALCAIFLLNLFNVLSIELHSAIWSVVLGSICFFLIGFVDDSVGLSPISRLLVQLSVSSYVWLADVRIEFVTIPGLGLTHLGWLSLPVTVIWLVGVVNAINWIDGLDGLASGVSGIAATASFIICVYTGQYTAALLVVALSGSLLGFLYYNFNPAQIFMGDGGSYFIGFLLAGVAVIGLVKGATVTAIFLPFLILAVPIFDMSAVIVARLRQGCSPFLADKRHLHHRLLQAGLSHRSTVLVIYAIALWVGSLAITFVGMPNSLVILGGATGLLGYMSWKAWQSAR